MIKWKEEYKVGVEEIDKQHQKLFEISNRAYQLFKNDLLIDKYDQIISVLEELKDYAVYHFKYEEGYMTSIGYKRILSHKVEHNDFIEKVNGVDFNKVDEDQSRYLMDILNFVVRWIEVHILNIDKKITME